MTPRENVQAAACAETACACISMHACGAPPEISSSRARMPCRWGLSASAARNATAASQGRVRRRQIWPKPAIAPEMARLVLQRAGDVAAGIAIASLDIGEGGALVPGFGPIGPGCDEGVELPARLLQGAHRRMPQIPPRVIIASAACEGWLIHKAQTRSSISATDARRVGLAEFLQKLSQTPQIAHRRIMRCSLGAGQEHGRRGVGAPSMIRASTRSNGSGACPVADPPREPSVKESTVCLPSARIVVSGPVIANIVHMSLHRLEWG